MLTLIALTLAPRAAAHTTGISTAEFNVLPLGRVEARLMFATAEPLGGLSLDHDGDGVVTAEEVAAAEPDLRAFVLGGVEVKAGGVACAATFESAAATELDGLVLRATYDCPRAARGVDVEVTLYYLNALRRGHREAVRLVSGSTTSEALLAGDVRALAMRLPPDYQGRKPAAWPERALRVVALCVAASAVAFATRRARRLRA